MFIMLIIFFFPRFLRKVSYKCILRLRKIIRVLSIIASIERICTRIMPFLEVVFDVGELYYV